MKLKFVRYGNEVAAIDHVGKEIIRRAVDMASKKERDKFLKEVDQKSHSDAVKVCTFFV